MTALGDLTDRCGVGEVTTHRHVGQQQVLLDERHEHLDVGVRKAELRPDRAHQLHAHDRVIAGVPLAQIVEQAPEHQQVRTGDTTDERGGVGGGLPQMPVDREAVVGVALRLRAHRLPLGKQPGHEIALIE